MSEVSGRNSRRQLGGFYRGECCDVGGGVSGDEAGIDPLFQLPCCYDDVNMSAPLAYLFPARLAPSNIRIIAGAIVVVQESIEKSP